MFSSTFGFFTSTCNMCGTVSTEFENHARLVIVTGLPATGKTTLARQLAQRYGVALIGKDFIKEPLLDIIGADSRTASRKLSDASFAVLFTIARELVAARVDLVLEGNFRPGEHESAFRAVLAPLSAPVPPPRVAQVLCRIDEPTRRLRLAQRADDATRHPGHRDAQLATLAPEAGNEFLELAGERFFYEGEATALDRWWRAAGTRADRV